MLHDIDSPESACSCPEPAAVDRKARALIQTMADCCHPRVGRLTERLRACNEPEQLRALQGEVLNLLALSFGPAEGQRRLQELQ
jgi:hypothetical protein